LETLKYTITSSDYTNQQLELDKKELIDLLGGEEGVSVSLGRLRQIQKESISSSASSEVLLKESEAGIVSVEQEIVSLEQEIVLLKKEFDQLDAEKQKDLATVSGDQSVQALDLYTISLDSKKIINESNRDLIVADAEVKAAKKALSEVTGISSQTAIYAPFDGTISRKNVAIGQAVQSSTPIYDIVGSTRSNAVFIR
jgi:multidrug resistance efflux pump